MTDSLISGEEGSRPGEAARPISLSQLLGIEFSPRILPGFYLALSLLRDINKD